MLTTLNLLNEEDSEGSEAESQKNASDWKLSISEKELSSKDEIENAPDLSGTSDATTLPVTSNSNQSPVSSNPSIFDETAVEEIANDGIKLAFIGFDFK